MNQPEIGAGFRETKLLSVEKRPRERLKGEKQEVHVLELLPPMELKMSRMDNSRVS
ncbi:MAG: hypothetical protein QGG23_07240 [Candidatus Bathyarchaeota archaeon]|jgi:hypothetical protein|nr:hypothetical protein [Candidatus Bathyarchaeota archaeon]MDP7443143.1 hypothetical protein [Candidatus Bathyarchaeota archaeon]|tara:strand:+ start:882 stop:1049 length:168 start_codon:yes stop_codon:yes gene_type:complete